MNAIRILAMFAALCVPLVMAWAQMPPPSGTGPNCIDRNTLRADVIERPLMDDDDGDIWWYAESPSTGERMIGFLSRNTRMFCVMAKGAKRNPRS